MFPLHVSILVPGCQNGRFWGLPAKVGKGTSGPGEPRARLGKIFWYQDTGYPVHRCVCVSISPPHPTHPHPTPPQVVWWCYVSMCDLWWYGGEVAQTKKEILVPGYRLPGILVCLCIHFPTPPHPSPPHPTPPQVAWWCDVRMCDLWWYGGEVADRIDNTLDRLVVTFGVPLGPLK